MTRAQLLDAGLDKDAIRRRLRSGRLHLRHPNVYAVGHVPADPVAHEIAALLAAGLGAVLSHESAAVHLGLLQRRPRQIHVTRPGGPHRTLDGVVLHRPNDLPPQDLLLRSAVPTTTPLRTILDLAATASPHLDRALNEALVQRKVDPHAIRARAEGRRGAGALHEALADGPRPTRSEAERRLLGLVAAAGLPQPRTNVHLAGYEVDALWPEHRLVVEVDGYAYHHTRRAFERDRTKDADLHAHGYRTLRLTWRQLTTDRERTAATLATAFAAGAPRETGEPGGGGWPGGASAPGAAVRADPHRAFLDAPLTFGGGRARRYCPAP